MAVAGKYFSLHKHSVIDQFFHTDYLDFFGFEEKIEYIYINLKWRKRRRYDITTVVEGH